MPGRHGKQVTKRGRSKRQRPSQMENTLKDSIRSRARKERSILQKLIAPKVEKRFANAVTVSPLMPMFAAAPPPLHAPNAPDTPAPAKNKKSAAEVAAATFAKKSVVKSTQIQAQVKKVVQGAQQVQQSKKKKK